MIEYVCGLLFNEDLSKIVLIVKNKPAHLKGLLNGIGGKVEPGEGFWQAMIREFEEETGLHTTTNDWINFAVLNGFDPMWQQFKVHWFTGQVPNKKFNEIKSMEEEVVAVYYLDGILNKNIYETVSNLKWLISLALSAISGKDDCIYYELNEKHWRYGSR